MAQGAARRGWGPRLITLPEEEVAAPARASAVVTGTVSTTARTSRAVASLRSSTGSAVRAAVHRPPSLTTDPADDFYVAKG